MIYRKFNKRFKERIGTNGFKSEGNVIYDFVNYAYDMGNDLKMIEKYDDKLFNSLSHTPIEIYKSIFEKLYNDFLHICTNIPNHRDYVYTNYIPEDSFKQDLIVQNGEYKKINDKYYTDLNKIAKNIFLLEYEISKVVSKIWDKQLSDTNNLNFNEKYLAILTAKYKNRRNEMNSEENDDFSNNMPFEYSSVNSNDFTYIFE